MNVTEPTQIKCPTCERRPNTIDIDLPELRRADYEVCSGSNSTKLNMSVIGPLSGG